MSEDAQAEHHAEGAPLEPGQRLAGRYELVERLGAGGMGQVFAARELGATEDAVAPEAPWVVKVLAPRAGPDGEVQRQRFLRSAALQARLSLPGVAVARDYGEDESGRCFLVMARDPARRSLRALLSEAPDARRGWREVVVLLRRLAEVLGELHARGVVHRDIKPSNILVYEDLSGPQLIDFGIARDLGSGESLTKTGASPGFSPQYGAPELHRSAGDARADIFSLGVTALELLSGQAMPAKGPHDFPGLRVPRRLHALIRAMTDTDPEARPRSAAAVIAALEHLELRRWPAVLGLAALALGVGALTWLGVAELRAARARTRALGGELADVKAERDRLVEAAQAPADPPPVAPVPVTPEAHPGQEALAAFEGVMELGGALRAGERSAEVLDAQRERWADLEQQSPYLAIREAARARRLSIDAALLQRRYLVTLESVRKPFEVADKVLYLDFGAPGEEQRIVGLEVESESGVARLRPAEAAPPLTLSGQREVTLRLALHEDRAYAFDKTLLDQTLTLPLPLDLELLSEGVHVEVAGPDGLVLRLHLRRP